MRGTDLEQNYDKIRERLHKGRFERVIPITDGAVAALERSAPRGDGGGEAEGPIFGRHRYDRAIAMAAMQASMAGLMDRARAEAVSIYDFRHGRTTHLCSNTKNLAAVAYLVGHRHVSTTAKYVESNKAAAAEVLRGLDPASPPSLPAPDGPTE